MKNNTDWSLIKRWLEGKASEEDAKRIDQWLSADPQNQEVLDELSGRWEAGKESIFNAETAYQRLAPKLSESTNFEREMPPRRRYGWLKIAASLLLIATLGYTVLRLAGVQADHVEWVEKQTSANQLASITLKDGTVVHLNSQTTLRYPENFEDSREIVLDGEAYFEVARDTLRPFSVQTGDVITTVLGTAFNIRAFSESDVEVTVTSGKVNVREEDGIDENSSFNLIAGEQALYELKTGHLARSQVDTAPFLAWRDRSVNFDRLPFPDALKQLSRVYNVPIALEGKETVECLVRGKYTNEPLRAVLDGLQLIVDFDYTINSDGSIEVKAIGCLD